MVLEETDMMKLEELLAYFDHGGSPGKGHKEHTKRSLRLCNKAIQAMQKKSVFRGRIAGCVFFVGGEGDYVFAAIRNSDA